MPLLFKKIYSDRGDNKVVLLFYFFVLVWFFGGDGMENPSIVLNETAVESRGARWSEWNQGAGECRSSPLK